MVMCALKECIFIYLFTSLLMMLARLPTCNSRQTSHSLTQLIFSLVSPAHTHLLFFLLFFSSLNSFNPLHFLSLSHPSFFLITFFHFLSPFLNSLNFSSFFLQAIPCFSSSFLSIFFLLFAFEVHSIIFVVFCAAFSCFINSFIYFFLMSTHLAFTGYILGVTTSTMLKAWSPGWAIRGEVT